MPDMSILIFEYLTQLTEKEAEFLKATFSSTDNDENRLYINDFQIDEITTAQKKQFPALIKLIEEKLLALNGGFDVIIDY